MLHLRPDLVRPLEDAGGGEDNAIKIQGIREGWAWTERRWSLATNDTGVGDPRKATAEKGERFFKDITQKLSGLLVEIANADLNDLYEKP